MRARQRRIGGRTGDGISELAAERIRGPLRHQTIGHQLTAGDGDKAFQAVAPGVVEQHNTATDAAPAGIVIAGDQRTYAGVGAQYPRPPHDRRQLFPFAQQRFDLLGRYPVVVNFVIGDMHRSGANQRNSIAGHQNIGVSRFAAAVDNLTVNAVVED